jgi:hypothetical protein
MSAALRDFYKTSGGAGGGSRHLVMIVQLVSLGLLALGSIRAQDDGFPLPSSWPHNYTGIPSGAYSPEWQKCA